MSYDSEGDPNTIPVGVHVDEGMTEERFRQLSELPNLAPLVNVSILEECLKEIARQKRIVEAENAGIMQALAEMDKANYLTIMRERDQVYAELKEALDAGTALPVELIAQAKKWRSLAKGTAEQIEEVRKIYDADMERCADTILALEKERDHWREARRTAIEGGEELVKQRDGLNKTVASLQAEVRAMKPVIEVATQVVTAEVVGPYADLSSINDLELALLAMDTKLVELVKGNVEPSPHFCEHANEVPQRCPCMSVCYCRQAGNTCASEG